MSRAGDAQRALGARLRDLRKSLGLSLAAVEEKSGGVWKAVVVGSYERGDRAITVGRLVDLADFYHVAPWDLLKPAETAAGSNPEAILAEARLHAKAASDLLAQLFSGDCHDRR